MDEKTIVVEILGGCVQNVFVKDHKNVRVLLIDWDNIKDCDDADSGEEVDFSTISEDQKPVFMKADDPAKMDPVTQMFFDDAVRRNK